MNNSVPKSSLNLEETLGLIFKIRWTFWFCFTNYILFTCLGFTYLFGIDFTSSPTSLYFYTLVIVHFFLLSLPCFVITLGIFNFVTDQDISRKIISILFVCIFIILMFDSVYYNEFAKHLNTKNLILIFYQHLADQSDLVSFYFLFIPFILLFEMSLSEYLWRNLIHLRIRGIVSILALFFIFVVISWNVVLYTYSSETNIVEVLQYRNTLPLMHYLRFLDFSLFI